MSDKLLRHKFFPAISLSSLLTAVALFATTIPGFAADEEAVFKDPTRPPAKKVAALPVVDTAPVVDVIVETKRSRRPVKRGPKPLTLSSVLVSEQRRRAVINGQIVEEGQLVAGARVLEISLNGVTVQRAGRSQILTLVRSSVKRRSASGQ